MLENTDYWLTQLDFDPDELACIGHRSFWYIGIIAVLALISVLIGLNISAHT